MTYSYKTTSGYGITLQVGYDTACTTACSSEDGYNTISCVNNNGNYVTIRYVRSVVDNSAYAYTTTSISPEMISTINNIYSGSAYSNESYAYISKLGGYYSSGLVPLDPKQAKRESLRSKIRAGLSSRLSTRFLPRPSEEEDRARKLLLSLVGEERYHLYLKRGFVVEQGKSGLRYKIKPGHSMVEVLHPKKDGKFFKFRSLCIQPKVSGLPPTDAVIMRLLLVRNDEFAMQKLSNVTVLATPSAEDERGVSEFLKERVA